MSFLFSQLLRNDSYFVLQVRLDRCKARQTRLIDLLLCISHFPQFVCMVANAIHTFGKSTALWPLKVGVSLLGR